jgi:predicted RNase H-like nuclease
VPPIFSGIDGAPGGWISVTWIKNKFIIEFQEKLSSFSFSNKTITLIDMPIGLPCTGYRQCDVLGRKLLGIKRSSLFFVPSREAVFAESYSESCQKNLARQNVKLSKQVWNICPKIKELDALLRREQELRKSIFEAHPEIAFYKLNKNLPLRYSKKTLEGRRERIDLLINAFGSTSIKNLITVSESQYPKLLEDIIDAASLVGLLKLSGKKLNFVGDSSCDKYRLPMQIAC